jgi:acyl carrier protein/seryl-tRNA synthetase
MLTATELKEQLLRFTREKLAGPDLRDSVTADARLFEDRIIDSLKVLELIAFVQSAIGRKIPDSQIVLANFRTIATIARVFSGAAPAEQRARTRRAGKRPSSDHQSAVQELIGTGLIELTPDGGLLLRGEVAALYDYFDSVILGWAEDLGAVEQSFPDEIPIETLERAGFVSSFPDKLVRDESVVRPPAVCYHCYPAFTNRVVPSRGSVITAVGRSFRNEFDAHAPYPEERLRAFTMREVIALGAPDFVERVRTGLIERTRIWVKELGLDGDITEANDPFFTAESRGRALMQQLLPLKYELRLRVGDDGRTLAAASFNNHLQHFSRAFSIRLSSGEHATTGCVAYGWERWLIAFINQHGSNPARWPESARGRDVAAV